MNSLDRISALVARGALFVVNHSGGKDSQAMLHVVRQHVPDAQIVIVHALLPGADWEGVEDHVHANSFGLPVYVTQSSKTFAGMVRGRGYFPTPQFRQCTSDLKRGPLEKLIRSLGAKLIVNCMGLRAQESPNSRGKLAPFKLNASNSKAGREWYDWLPIHQMLLEEVWATIKAAGQEPHWAYAKGMSRLSCCFCIMGNRSDMQTAARLKPDLYAEYVALEEEVGHTMHSKKVRGVVVPVPLEEFTGIKAHRIIPLKIAA